MNNTPPPDNLMTVAAFCERHKWVTPGGLRWALYNRARNGFEACVVRWGRKILLDESRVLIWVRESGRNLSPAPVATPGRAA